MPNIPPDYEEAEDEILEVPSNFGFKRLSGFPRFSPVSKDHSSTPGGEQKSSPPLEPETPKPSDIYLERSYFNVYSIIVSKDGSGDFESISQAIANLDSAGGTIFLKEGVYSEDVSLGSNIALVGAGASSHINGSVSSVSKSGVVVRDLKVNSISFNSVVKSVLLNCFLNTDGDVSINSCSEILVQGCTLSGGQVVVYNSSETVTVLGNVSINTSAVAAFRVDTSSYISFENNTADSASIGFLCTQSASWVNFIGNFVFGCSDVGIQVEDSSSKVTVSGNQANNNTNFGIRLFDVDRCVATSNIALSNGTNLGQTSVTNCVVANNITS